LAHKPRSVRGYLIWLENILGRTAYAAAPIQRK
jgi:hypothetical protein